MVQRNQEIKQEAKAAGIRLWQIAERLGLTDGNFSRKLRHELPQKDKAVIMRIIEEIKADDMM